MARDIPILDMRGFTLIELIVVIAIVILISAAIVPSFGSGEESLALDRAAHRVSRDIRDTMGRALNGEIYREGNPPENECVAPGPNGPGSMSPGYGIYFDASTPTSYFVFVNCNPNSAWQPGNVDEVVETFSLEKGVQIFSVNPPTTSIFFEAPDPKIFINNGTDVSMQIVFQAGGRQRTITVTDKGVIDID